MRTDTRTARFPQDRAPRRSPTSKLESDLLISFFFFLDCNKKYRSPTKATKKTSQKSNCQFGKFNQRTPTGEINPRSAT